MEGRTHGCTRADGGAGERATELAEESLRRDGCADKLAGKASLSSLPHVLATGELHLEIVFSDFKDSRKTSRRHQVTRW